jgi:hypothetical protein
MYFIADCNMKYEYDIWKMKSEHITGNKPSCCIDCIIQY